MWFSVALVCCIGFIYTNNFTLSLTPARWKQKYFADPSGWNLNLLEPTVIPRFLHFFTGAIAVGGLVLVFLSLFRSRKDGEYGRALFQFGGKAFLYATMVQFLWACGSSPVFRATSATFFWVTVLSPRRSWSSAPPAASPGS